MSSINIAILLGNVGNEPEIKSIPNGDQVASFSLATSEPWKDKNTGERKETTEWHKIVCFNQNLIPIIRDYVHKGSKIAVDGALKTRKWQDRDGVDRWTTEIVIGRFDGKLKLVSQPPGAKRSEDDYGQTRTKEPRQQAGATADRGAPLNDDIPF